LRAFAWKRLLKLLEGRRERIASEFKRIEDDKAEIEKIKSQYSEKLKSIQEMARVKIEEALLEGEKIKLELKENAKKEAAKILERAKSDIRGEILKAKAGLKDEVTELVIEATEKVLEKKVSEEDDKQIVQDFIDKIDRT
jgi:F-type H+-transporting ATPase subunit b